jgi:hypothetical protein
MKIESILQTTAKIQTYQNGRHLTNATGFYFERDNRLFLVTCQHVLHDPLNHHRPDQIVIELNTGEGEYFVPGQFSLPLYQDGLSIWKTCSDIAGDVDVATIEIDRNLFPQDAVFHAFTPAHLTHLPASSVEVGQSILIVGFPLGFQDNLHYLPVVRQAIIASSFGLRFQGQGYFLTDARTHRGTSGAPVVLRLSEEPHSSPNGLPWLLLGVHSARLDVGTRDLVLDEALGLNCAWYADVLMKLTSVRSPHNS